MEDLAGPQDYFIPPARTITAVKVDATPVGRQPAQITIRWTGRNGQQCSLPLEGVRAHEVIIDLHASSMLGDASRLSYLIGYLRCHGHLDGGGG